MTPYRVVFGREPPKIIKYNHSTGDDSNVQQQLQERDATIAQFKNNLTKAQQRMKVYADGKRKDLQLAVG